MSFSNSFKAGLFNINDRNFNEKALELFNYQAKNNLIYSKYLQYLKIEINAISHYTQIPFLPLQFFKTQKIVTGEEIGEVVFYSSGTTGEVRSKHIVSDLSFYKKVAEQIFYQLYGPLNEYVILALLPSYLENKNSSLIYMINHFIEKTGTSQSGFVLNEFGQISKKIDEARKLKKKIILWGVSYALLDLSEKFPMDLSDVIVMETGGMKGRREEMIRKELHEVLEQGFNVKYIHSEYGMTELLSQAYSLGSGIFKTAPWMKILTREIQDPLTINLSLHQGGINVIDLANVDSCAFLETQDIGKVFADNTFEIIGRFDNSDIRGCNLLYSS